MKYGDWQMGETEALLNILGGAEMVRELLREHWEKPVIARDEPVSEGVEGRICELVLRRAIQRYFDRHGRRIPRGLEAAACDANREFRLAKPEKIDCAAVLARLKEHFPEGTPFMTAEEFERAHREMLREIGGMVEVAKILRGVCLPLPLPQLRLARGKEFDYGRVLERDFVFAAKASYEAEFPGRTFHNWTGSLEGRVSVVNGTRHDRLAERLFRGPASALWFPNPLQGFSILADREQLAGLPERLLLCGGIDTLTGIAAYPDVIGYNFKTLGLHMAAVSWGSAGDSFFFEARADNARFDNTDDLAVARAGYSGGLLFFG